MEQAILTSPIRQFFLQTARSVLSLLGVGFIVGCAGYGLSSLVLLIVWLVHLPTLAVLALRLTIAR